MHVKHYSKAAMRTKCLCNIRLKGNFTSSMHSPEDAFWGQLAGCMEMIDCGTTSVVDFSHINYSSEHSKDMSTSRQ